MRRMSASPVANRSHRVLRQRLLHHAVDRRHSPCAHRGQRARRLGEAPGQDDRLRSRPRERRLAREHLVEHRHRWRRCRPGRRRPSRRSPAPGHVLRRADREAGRGQRLAAAVTHRARDAEVGHQRVALAEQDVGRLDVAVDDAALGARRPALRRPRAPGGAPRRPGAAPSRCSRSRSDLALDVRHDVVEEAVGLARVVHRQDVRMAELRRDLDLAQEPVGAERGGQLRPHHLHRHLAMVLQVRGQVHRRHPALAQDPLDLVAAGQRLGRPVAPRTRRSWPCAAAPRGRSGWRRRSACRTAPRAAVGYCRPGRCVRWFSGCFQGAGEMLYWTVK